VAASDFVPSRSKIAMMKKEEEENKKEIKVEEIVREASKAKDLREDQRIKLQKMLEKVKQSYSAYHDRQKGTKSQGSPELQVLVDTTSAQDWYFRHYIR
jgi:hypothetical protein